MADKSPKNVARHDSYSQLTHRPLNCLLLIAPLLLAHQIGTAYYGTALMATRDLGRVLSYFGATGRILRALLIVAALGAHHVIRRDPFQLRLGVLSAMTAESILWAVPLAVWRMRPVSAVDGLKQMVRLSALDTVMP